MQFASRRSFCRRVTAFTDFERTIPARLSASMVSQLRISVNSDNSGNNFNRKPVALPAARHRRCSVHDIREKQRCINFCRGRGEKNSHRSREESNIRSWYSTLLIFSFLDKLQITITDSCVTLCLVPRRFDAISLKRFSDSNDIDGMQCVFSSIFAQRLSIRGGGKGSWRKKKRRFQKENGEKRSRNGRNVRCIWEGHREDARLLLISGENKLCARYGIWKKKKCKDRVHESLPSGGFDRTSIYLMKEFRNTIYIICVDCDFMFISWI